MRSSEYKWSTSLQGDLEPTEVIQAFRAFLSDFLPMSQQQLGRLVGVDRVTVNKWAKGKADPSLSHQRAVVKVVLERLDEIKQHAARTEEMIAALDNLESARRALSEGLNQEALDKVTEANQHVRTLLRPED
jgi:DNA-binding XRE family transcriptional regulator